MSGRPRVGSGDDEHVLGPPHARAARPAPEGLRATPARSRRRSAWPRPTPSRELDAARRRRAGHLPRGPPVGLHAHARRPGRARPPAGRGARRDRPAGTRSAAAYERFLGINQRPARRSAPPGSSATSTASPVVNDHTDAAYDAGVIARLAELARRGRSRSAPTSAPRSTASPATAPGSATALAQGAGRRRRLVHQADDRQLPHGLVRAARGPAGHARHRARRRRGRADGHRPLRPGAHRDGHAVHRRRRPRPRRRGDAGPLARRPRQRRARRRRHHRRGPRRSPTTRRSSSGRAVREAVDVPLLAGTRHQRHRATPCELSRAGRRHAASTASSSSRRTTTARRRPGFEAHFRAVAAATDLPVVLYDIPGRTGRKVDTDAASSAWPTRCPPSSALKDAAGNPGETARVDRRGARRLRGLQRRRPDDPAAPRRRRRRRDRHRHPLVRAESWPR